MEAEPSSPDANYDRTSPFISIDEFINHETLEPKMLSIPDYIEHIIKKERIGKDIITPLALADSSVHVSEQALEIVESLYPSVIDFSYALVS
jgi:hypothetical protein